jgi:phage-related minor tail protein
MANEVKIILSADGSGVKVVTGDVIQEFGKVGEASKDATATAARAGEEFIVSLKKQADQVGKTREELLTHRTAVLGVSDAAKPYIDSIAKAAEHTEKFGFNTARSKTELLVLAHEMSQGNYQKFGGSMMVLGEQTGAAGLLFSAAGLAALGLVAAAVGVTYAMVKGAQEQKAMHEALVMTGNYAGTTTAGLDALAHSAVATGGSLREAKTIVTELAASGKYTAEQIGTVSEAVMAVEHATGGTDKSVEKLVKQFESLSVQASDHSRYSDAISKATLKLDDEYHFLTTSVYEQIRSLELEGQQKEASRLATDEFAKVTKERADEINANLGSVATGWRAIKGAIGDAVSAIGDFGKASTQASRLASEEASLTKLRQWQAESKDTPNGLENAWANSAVAAQEQVVIDLRKELLRVNEQVAAQGEATRVQSEGAHAAAAITAMDLRIKGGEYAKLIKDVNEYNTSLERLRAANPKSAALNQDAIDAHMAGIIKLDQVHTSTPKAKTVHVAADPWDTSVAKAYAKALDDLDKVQISASSSADSLSKTQVALRSVQASPTWAAFNHQKQEQILMEAMLSQAEEDRLAAAEAAIKVHDEYVKSLNESAKSIEKKLVAMGDEVAAYAMSIDQNISLAQAVDQVAVARLNEELAKQMSYGDNAAVAALQREIAAREKLAGLIKSQDAHKASVDAAKAAADEWKKTADSINKDITDALMRGFESGKGFADNLKTTLENMFKTMVLRPVIEAIVSPVSQGITSLLTGGQGGAGGAGGVGNLMGTASSLSSLYNLYSGGSSVVTTGSQVIGGSMSLANAYGTVAANTGGTGLSGLLATNGAYGTAAAGGSAAGGTAAGAGGASAGGAYVIPVVGWIMAAMAANGSLYDKGYKWDNKYAAIDPVVAITDGLLQRLGVSGKAAAVFSGSALQQYLGDKIFGSSNKEITASGIEGTFAKTGFLGNNYASYKQDGGWFHGDTTGKYTSALDPNTVQSWSSSFAVMQAAVAGTASSLGLATDKIYAYTKAVNIAAGSTAEQMTALFGGMADDMSTAVAPAIASFAKVGETSSATLTRLSTSITTANAWLSMLRNRLFDVSVAGGDAASKLADAFGGLINLAASSKAFYETYYTEGERAARSQEDMSRALALVNLALPDSKDALKALAATLDLNTDAGRTAYAVLLAIAPEFASTADSLAKLAKDASDKLLATFTGGGLLLPALDASRLKVDALSVSTGAMTGELSFINQVMGDASSTVIGFAHGTYTLNTNLTDSQWSAGLLNSQIVALKDNSDKTRVNFDGLSLALLGVDARPVSFAMGSVNQALTMINSRLVDASVSSVNQALAGVNAIPVGMSVSSVNQALTLINSLPVGASVADINQALAGVNALPVGTSMASVNQALTLINSMPVGTSVADVNRALAGVNTTGVANAIGTVNTALNGVNTETFVATLSQVFTSLATRIKGTLDAIGTERIAVRDAALQIINPTVMSKEAIGRGIAGINTALPSNDGIILAGQNLALADAAVASAKALKIVNLATAQAALSTTLGQQAGLVASVNTGITGINALVAKYGVQQQTASGSAAQQIYVGGSGTLQNTSQYQQLWGNAGAFAGFKDEFWKSGGVYDQTYGKASELQALADNVAAQSQTVAGLNISGNGVPAVLIATQTAAAAAAKTATLGYASALQDFTIDASKSVGKLTALRQETVKYYDAQKALADLMGTSAAGLRKTVADYNYGQKTPEQQLAELQGKYASAYSTAMSVQGDGATLAGYGDQLNALLSPLIAKLQETGQTNLIGSYLAQADAVAGLIEKVIPVNYQQDSLAMLGSIDATLAALDASSSSAEKIISAAVAAGADKTSAGLHAVVAALTYQAIPAFASGGAYMGGLALVGERGPELINFGQPGQVYNANQTRGMFSGGAAGGNADVVAELRALRQDNANMRAELRAIAVAVTKTAKQGDRVTPGNDAIQVRVIA